MTEGLTKQWEEPLSIKAFRGLSEFRSGGMVTDTRKELGSERADALRRASGNARAGSMQPSVRAESGGPLRIFLSSRTCSCPRTWRRLLLLLRLEISCNLLRRVQDHRKRGKAYCQNGAVVPPE